MTNNQFGRLELMLEKIKSCYEYTSTGYVLNPDKVASVAFDVVDMFKAEELGRLIGPMKDIYNTNKPVSITPTREGE